MREVCVCVCVCVSADVDRWVAAGYPRAYITNYLQVCTATSTLSVHDHLCVFMSMPPIRTISLLMSSMCTHALACMRMLQTFVLCQLSAYAPYYTDSL